MQESLSEKFNIVEKQTRMTLHPISAGYKVAVHFASRSV
jgi:hypothetical protein